MKFNFRKISALGASLLMAGMTMGVAVAANYPAPFVENGSADAAIVHGTGPGVSLLDSVEAGNIQKHLSTFVTDTGPITIVGDSIRLDKSSNRLNLGDAINGPFGSTVNDEDLDLLADGTYKADDSDTFDYEQKIKLGSMELAHFQNSDYEDILGVDVDTPVVGINITSNQFVMNYTINFLDQPESDVVSGNLDDLKGSFLPLLGKIFYVSDWDNGTISGETGKLTLLDAAVKGFITEGEIDSVTLNGVNYDISITWGDSDSVVMNVNEEDTSDLAEGTTEKLSDGTYIGITDVRYKELVGETVQVEYSLGTGKIELEHKTDIQLNDETVADVKAYLYKGTPSSGVAKIDKIVIEWKADDDMFITPESEISLPGLGGLKFSMTDFVRSEEDLITVKPDGDESIKITLPIKDGSATINLLYSNDTDDLIGIGKSATRRLATSPVGNLTFWEEKGNSKYHKYFVASFNDSDDGESYLLSFNTIRGTGTTANKTDIWNEVSNAYEAQGYEATDVVDIGNVQFTIQEVFVNTTDEYVNITAGANTVFNTVYTTGGLRIYLPYMTGSLDELDDSLLHNVYARGSFNLSEGGAINFSRHEAGGSPFQAGADNDTWYLVMDGENKDDDIASGTSFRFRIDENADNDLEIDQVDTTGTFSGTGGVQGKEQASTNTYEAYVYDDVAPKILHYTNPEEDYVEIYYPGGNSQSYAEIYLTETGATTIAETGVLIVKDSEVSQVSTKNLIIVGGSCINTAAAALMGGALCGSAWTDATGVGSGQFLVKAYPDSGGLTSKLAMLVAGYEQSDTEAASTYIQTQEFDSSTANYVGPVLGI